MEIGTERVLVGRVEDRSSESYIFLISFLHAQPLLESLQAADSAFVMLSTY